MYVLKEACTVLQHYSEYLNLSGYSHFQVKNKSLKKSHFKNLKVCVIDKKYP